MIFAPTKLAGAVVIDLERREDDRGFFARSFCQREFEEHHLDPCVSQCNVSFNVRRGTLRGMHWQAAPHGEAKLVRVTRGAIWDVIIDLRPDSSSYAEWFGIELTAENRRALYIPSWVRARVPDARPRHGSFLSDVVGLRSRCPAGPSLE